MLAVVVVAARVRGAKFELNGTNNKAKRLKDIVTDAKYDEHSFTKEPKSGRESNHRGEQTKTILIGRYIHIDKINT